jgi:hypothetical protein
MARSAKAEPSSGTTIVVMIFEHPFRSDHLLVVAENAFEPDVQSVRDRRQPRICRRLRRRSLR